MKLLMISTDGNILNEGSGVQMRQIEYAKKYDEVHIIVFTMGHRDPKEMIQITGNLFVHPTHSQSKISCIKDAIHIGREIIKNARFSTADMITTQDPFLTGVVGKRLKKKFNIPLEIQIHTDIGSPYFASESLKNKIFLYLAKKNIPYADHIRVVSERIRRFLIEGKLIRVPELKIEVRPIMIDTEKIKNMSITVDVHKKYPQFRKIILMASRLTKEKDIVTAIKAFAQVHKNISDTGLIIVGSGPELENLQLTTNNLQLQDDVIFEPWIEQTTLFSYYKTADIFLSTSLYEGYGMSMAEADAAGCPIVATDAGIAPKIARHLCSVGDVVCIANAIEGITR